MKKILALLFGVFIVSCAALSVYFVIVLISSTDTVTEQYEAMTKPDAESHGTLKYNIVSAYYGKTKDDQIFIKLNVSSSMRDSIVSRYSEDADLLEGQKPQTNIPECTCTGTTPCSAGHVQDCEACKQNTNYCKLHHSGYSDGQTGDGWEALRNIPIDANTNGFATWRQQPKGSKNAILSSGNNPGCCFFVAMLGLCNANGTGANVADVFKAAGVSNATVDSTGQIQTDIRFDGSCTLANKILSNLGTGLVAKDNQPLSDVNNGGTYLIHVTNESNGIYASTSAGEHWFVVQNGTVVTPAQGKQGQAFDPSISNGTFNHVYKIE